MKMVKYPDGTKKWFAFGNHLHRLNGPAIEWSNGYKEWYIQGENLTEEQFNLRIKNMKSKEPIRTVGKSGVIFYKNNKNQFHRLDGPAIIHPNGIQCWYLYGEELDKDEFNRRIK